MKKLLLITLALLMACVTCFAASRTDQISGKFNAISATHNIKVTYTEGRKTQVKINTTPEQLANVKTYVKDGCLVITYDNNDQQNLQPIRVAVTSPMVSKVMLSGAAEFKSMGQLSGENIELATSGASEISVMGVSATTLKIMSSGASEVDVDRVMCETMTVGLSGQAETDVRAVTANKIEVSASGQAEFKCPGVNTSTLAVALSGQAEAKVKGKAMVASYSASGQATIKAEELPANGGSASASGDASIRCKVAGLKSNTSGTARITNLL